MPFVFGHIFTYFVKAPGVIFSEFQRRIANSKRKRCKFLKGGFGKKCILRLTARYNKQLMIFVHLYISKYNNECPSCQNLERMSSLQNPKLKSLCFQNI